MQSKTTRLLPASALLLPAVIGLAASLSGCGGPGAPSPEAQQQNIQGELEADQVTATEESTGQFGAGE